MNQSGIYLSIGSNLGDRISNLINCLIFLEKQQEIDIIAWSSFYETEAWGYKNQPDFLNQIVAIETTLNPVELLKKLKELEQRLGRKKTFVWGPRVIDIDILTYRNFIIEERDLIIPHPRMTERLFVLVPLKQIAPDFCHPKLKLSINELLRDCPDKSQIRETLGISEINWMIQCHNLKTN